MTKKIILVNNIMQYDYEYELLAPIGSNFDNNFNPELTPKKLLSMGIFGGKYFNDCLDEYPEDWFDHAKLSGLNNPSDPILNFFGVNCGMTLKAWQKRHWLRGPDPRGWMEWYFRYYYGRRIPELDEWQQKRWRQIQRHVAQIKKNCTEMDLECRKKQRQTLLHWAIDSRKI